MQEHLQSEKFHYNIYNTLSSKLAIKYRKVLAVDVFHN